MQINGLNVTVKGDRQNRAIIFIHGFLFDSSMWKKQIGYFSKKYYCITYDVRGFGKSNVGDSVPTMEDYCDDLLTIVNSLKPYKPVLCGLSMGGYIAFRAIEKEQNIFSAAIFCNTRASADDRQSENKRIAAIRTISDYGLKTFALLFFSSVFSKSFYTKSIDTVNFYINEASKYDRIGVVHGQLAMIQRTNVEPSLKDFKLPVLLIAGGKDTLSTPEEMSDLAKKIPNSQIAILPKSAHMTAIENPRIFNRAISEFLEKIIE